MNILVTGGCGYVGSLLVEKLLSEGHSVSVVDTQWFGNYLPKHSNLKIQKEDIRNIEAINMSGVHTIIHLANIANDPAVDLDQTLSWEVNALSSQQLADKAVKSQVKQIIYASSGSVYGVKDEPEVTEDLSLVPISAYNKTKMVAERVFLSYSDKLKIFCVRPATVCGFSPRMRLDVSVNMLTMQALENSKITVFGGSQTRPNIHIKDLVRVYLHFINNSDIEPGVYNAGFENISILEIAKMVEEKVRTEIEVSETNDPRSYRLSSKKLLSTGFTQKYSVGNAIDEIIEMYQNNLLEDRDDYYTIRTMKKILAE